MLTMRVLLKCVALIAVAAATATTTATATKLAPVIVADEQPFALTVNASERVATQTLVAAKGSTFLTVHFADFSLADGDKVVVRDVLGAARYEYTGLGRGALGKRDGFFSSRVPGDQAIVEFVPAAAVTGPTSSASADFGFTVDKIARSSTSASSSTVCGTDDSRPAKCYAGADALALGIPSAYSLARAVARLYITGPGSPCTGWLVGSRGHLLTNAHCIDSVEKAATTDFEFDAESGACSDECQSQLGCRGRIVATSAELVAFDSAIDYALVKLKTDIDLSQFGYLTMRVGGAVLGEQVYVPQHPSGWAKRIAAVDDSHVVARVSEIGAKTTCGSQQITYTADTRGGSSGSPVLAASDNRVVVLHSCGYTDALDPGCRNGGVDIRTVVWDLRNKGVALPDDAFSDPLEAVADGPWVPKPTPAPAPTPSVDAIVLLCRKFPVLSCAKLSSGRCVVLSGACVPAQASATQ